MTQIAISSKARRRTRHRAALTAVSALATLVISCAAPLTDEDRAVLAEEISDKPLLRMLLSESAGINPIQKTTETPHTRRLQASDVYRSLDYLRREVGEDAVAERIHGLAIDYATMDAAALWLRDQYMYTTSPSPRDGLWYFDALMHLYLAKGAPEDHRQHVGSMAVAVWVSSQLLALENHARCEDRSGGLVYFRNWEQNRRASVEQVWAALEPDMRASALQVAKQHSERAITRPPDPGPCASGRVAMNAARKAGRCRKTAPPPNADEFVGGSVAEFIHCDGEDFVRFVDDETWVGRLPALRASYWDRLFAAKASSTTSSADSTSDVASPLP